MTTVQYPSPVVPGPPPLHLEMPEGWSQVWAPETLIAIRQDDTGEGHFLANVVVRFFQRLAPFGPEQVKAELAEYAAAKPEGEMGPLKEQTIDGRAWVGADLAFADPAAGTIGQVHWFTARAQNDVMDVIQVTGSYGGARQETDYPTIDAVIDSVRITA